MYIKKLSLYVITFNEEKRLSKTLQAAKSLVDEIVIVDSGSTDNTENIAREFGARFIYHEWQNVGYQVKFAEDQCKYDWVLRLDADEVIPPALAEEILAIKANGTKDGYIIPIGEVYPGMKHANKWVIHYAKQIRLYNRKCWTMSGEIDHDAVVKLKTEATYGKCKTLIDHYSYVSIHQLITKYNNKSDKMLERSLVQHKNYSPWRLFGASTLEFIKLYILGRFFLLGWWGFIHCVNVSFLRFLKFAKFYEHFHKDY